MEATLNSKFRDRETFFPEFAWGEKLALSTLKTMELRPGWDHWESWNLSEREIRALWKLAKMAEWSAWNPHWRQYSCPVCGEPESMKTHKHCWLQRTLQVVYDKYPSVTEPPTMDALEEISAMEFLHDFIGSLDPKLRRGKDDPEPKEKGPDFSEPPPPPRPWEDDD